MMREVSEGTNGLATATVLLVRHAAHAQLGTMLTGRSPGLGLDATGRAQAAALARHLAGEPVAEVHSSPVQRARETAAALDGPLGLGIREAAALDEIDFGTWTGRSFAELAGDPHWERWNTARSVSEAPGGETMAAAQRRAGDHLRATADRLPGATVVMVSHCDIIRAVVADVLGLSLDAILRLSVDPASITRIAVGRWGAELVSLNETPWRRR